MINASFLKQNPLSKLLKLIGNFKKVVTSNSESVACVDDAKLHDSEKKA